MSGGSFDARLLEVLARTPLGFQRRLEIVLRQALDDEDDGTLELTAQASGQGEARTLRQWEGTFRARGRHHVERNTLTRR